MSTPAWIRRTIPESLRARRRQHTVNRFARLYYGRSASTWGNTHWLGIPVLKNPTDLWIYQEILTELRPDLIIETGTMHGGSALYLASICDLLGHGKVISVDIEDRSPYPLHDRIEFRTASSIDPGWLAELNQRVEGLGTVLTILDSDHSRDHVLAELRAYGPLVTSGSYVIVEDTNIHGHPVVPQHPPGPMEAVDVFLAESDEFTIDSSREKFLNTFNPRGYLQRQQDQLDENSI
jgi:cephalosporin hydroxylase